jgi:isopenicillin N synthase-like dioxygenase
MWQDREDDSMSTPSAASPIPVVDVSNRMSSRERRDELASTIDDACRTSGFLVVAGHGVDQRLVEAMDSVTRAFFRGPDRDKEACATIPGDATRRGFHRMGRVAASIGVQTPPDLCESFSINRLGEGDAAACSKLPSDHPLLRPNQWPDTPGFRTTWLEYMAAMDWLSSLLLTLFARGLGLPEEWFEDKVDHNMSNLGANYYPAQLVPPAPGQLRKGPHTDWGSLTILAQDTSGGLEVLGDGDRWHPVPIVDGAFVVNIGDLMAIWTNDRWVSTMHRVVNPSRARSGADRLSLAYFHQPNHDALIECIPTCAGERSPHAPVTSGDWFAQKLQLAYG